MVRAVVRALGFGSWRAIPRPLLDRLLLNRLPFFIWEVVPDHLRFGGGLVQPRVPLLLTDHGQLPLNRLSHFGVQPLNEPLRDLEVPHMPREFAL